MATLLLSAAYVELVSLSRSTTRTRLARLSRVCRPARSPRCDSTSRQRTGVPSPILTVDTFFPSLLFPCCHVMAKLISITSRLCYSTRSAHASWPLVRIRMVYLATPFLVSNCLFRFPLRLSTLLDRQQCRSGSCIVQVYITFHS